MGGVRFRVRVTLVRIYFVSHVRPDTDTGLRNASAIHELSTWRYIEAGNISLKPLELFSFLYLSKLYVVQLRLTPN